MKSILAALLLTVGAEALVSRGSTCCFHLKGVSGHKGEVGQLPDGQNRIGGHHPEGTYCIDGNGGLTDSHGRGCILTAPTTQFQCDVGASPTPGFGVNCHGQLTHAGSTMFYGCPTGDGGYNIYTKPLAGQPKCVAVTLESSGCYKKCGSGGGQCTKNLNGEYQFPHLIVPINSAQPNHAYGTSYNGEITSTISTVFNFDVPSSYAGKKCSLVFKLPKKSHLHTSSFHISGSGGIAFAKLQSPATQATDYANVAGVAQNYGVRNVSPGHSYSIAEFPCPAGQTVGYWAHTAGTHLTYFQDYNPPAIGLYITVC